MSAKLKRSRTTKSTRAKSAKATNSSKKRGIIALVIIVVLVGAFLYVANPDVRARFNSWVGIDQPDSVQQQTDSDKASRSKLKKKTPKKNTKNPKAIKPDKYAPLDQYARETPDQYAHDKVALANYLKKPAKNDVEKARLIYTWIATHIRYDDEAFNAGKKNDESVKNVLARRTALCEGFATLFLELGLQMNLKVEKISGHAKGYGFQTGEKFSSIDHSWNAVKIGRGWRLIDVTWGGSYGETTDKGLKSTMKFDPYWFNVRPDAFIFSHFPQNNSWQLIPEIITLKEYENLPSLKESFFKLGFDPGIVLQQALSGKTQEFVDTYHLDYPVNGAALPLAKKIERGKVYTFSIESEYLENVMIVDGVQRIELKKEGNLYTVTYTPTGEKLQIVVKVNSFDTKFSVIVVYDIVDKKDLIS